MKMRSKLLISAILAGAAVNCYALNPVVQTIYTADPAPVVHDGVCYLYADHDEDVIDPTVFIDDDGQAYLCWGNPRCWYVKLNKDMISYDTSIGDHGLIVHDMTVEAFGKRSKTDAQRLTTYEEGPWLYKRNGLYYLFFAAGPISEHIGYSTGPSPKGPWKYGGVVLPTQGGSFTDHPGVVDYQGKTCLFYHNGDLPGGGGFHRSICVDEMKFNPDGSVVQMTMTKQGAAPVATLNPYQRVEAETIAWESGVKTAQNGTVGVYVTDIHDGACIKVCAVDFGDKGASKFLASVAGVTNGSAIELRLDGPSGDLIGTLKVKPTGALDTWKSQSCRVKGAKGMHDLYLKFIGNIGNSSPLMNFDWWKFNK